MVRVGEIDKTWYTYIHFISKLLHINQFIRFNMCLRACVRAHVWVYGYMYACMYVWIMNTNLYIYVYVCMYVCMVVCMYVCIFCRIVDLGRGSVRCDTPHLFLDTLGRKLSYARLRLVPRTTYPSWGWGAFAAFRQPSGRLSGEMSGYRTPYSGLSTI